MHSPYPDDERRKSKRLRANFTLTYRVNNPLSLRMTIGWNYQIDALMLDLSDKGMAISTSYDILVATTILMKFTLISFDVGDETQVKSMEIIGEVKSNILLGKNEHRLGIHFIHIDEKDKNTIADFVKIASIKKSDMPR